jgi:hypothetical protein
MSLMEHPTNEGTTATAEEAVTYKVDPHDSRPGVVIVTVTRGTTSFSYEVSTEPIELDD